MSGTYYKHILAAIDLSEDNRKVIDKAVDRARSNGAKLSVIHVDVDLKLNPESKPADGNQITRSITLHGELDDEQRQRLLQIANACPVHKLLEGKVSIPTAMTEAAQA